METSTALPPAAAPFGISFDGRAWHYRQYSYDRFADALGYATLDQASPGFQEDHPPYRWPQWRGPTEQDRLQMEAHGIAYERGHYRYGPYRYEVLEAAMDYAKREPGLLPGGQAATGGTQ